MSYYYGSSSFSVSVLQPDEPEFDYEGSDSDFASPQEYGTDSLEEDSFEEDSSSADDESSESDTSPSDYILYILYFDQPFPGHHWGIYLQPLGNSMGECHDVWILPDGHTWERKTRFVEHVSHDTLIWDDGMEALRYLGRTRIGDVEDVEEFERVMEETPVPEGADEDENCQTWVRNVMVNAEREGVIGDDALAKLRTVPNY
ncbi:hypothetical protein BKA64DRAFT_648098 [Cadophora sp. MPI-SDFR-AT-0126]|nr:hypothetical protein BKA64DRAFT_648098 [Leotiomycetes sp. MPI-SDFR-AT-0126]